MGAARPRSFPGLNCGSGASTALVLVAQELLVWADEARREEEDRREWGPSYLVRRPAAPEAGHVVLGAGWAAATANSKKEKEAAEGAGEAKRTSGQLIADQVASSTPAAAPEAGHMVLGASWATAAAK